MVFAASLLLLSLLPAGEAAASVLAHDAAFRAFVEEHARPYQPGSAEYQRRQALFQEALREVEQWNSRPQRLWTAGINHLSDWTPEEKNSLYGYRGHGSVGTSAGTKQVAFLQSRSHDDQLDFDSDDDVAIALHKSWDKQAPSLLEVDDQGSCGSCWAVAAAKMAEANHQIFTGELRSFSAQELIECVPNQAFQCGGSGGCDGATVELAVWYMSKKGLSTKETKQYRGKNGKCHAKRSLAEPSEAELVQLVSPGKKDTSGQDYLGAKTINLLNWRRLPVNRARPLLAALNHGTVAVSAAASPWMMYMQGIFDGCNQNATINHAILAVGYGEDAGNKYWLIQNSWGGSWGEAGRIRLLRHEDDGEYCGVDKKPLDGTACKGGAVGQWPFVTEHQVCGMCGILFDNVFARFG